MEATPTIGVNMGRTRRSPHLRHAMSKDRGPPTKETELAGAVRSRTRIGIGTGTPRSYHVTPARSGPLPSPESRPSRWAPGLSSREGAERDGDPPAGVPGGVRDLVRPGQVGVKGLHEHRPVRGREVAKALA